MLAGTLRLALCCLITAFITASLAVAAEKNYQVVRFVGADKGNNQGKQVMILSVEPVGGGRNSSLYVPNNDPAKAEFDPNNQIKGVVQNLKTGDLIKVEIVGGGRYPGVASVAGWSPRPGELSPDGYIFVNSYRTKDGYEVVLTKMEQTLKAAVGKVKTEAGGMDVDQKLVERLATFKSGESVEAELGKGRVPTLFNIYPYKDPEAAKFVKMTEVEMDGQKAPAMELDLGGKPVTAILSGKMAGKKWVADPKLVVQVKKLKADAAINVRTVEEDGKIYLKRFEIPKKESSQEPTPAKGK